MKRTRRRYEVSATGVRLAKPDLEEIALILLQDVLAREHVEDGSSDQAPLTS